VQTHVGVWLTFITVLFFFTKVVQKWSCTSSFQLVEQRCLPSLSFMMMKRYLNPRDAEAFMDDTVPDPHAERNSREPVVLGDYE
jgi:hypothetical protein